MLWEKDICVSTKDGKEIACRVVDHQYAITAEDDDDVSIALGAPYVSTKDSEVTACRVVDHQYAITAEDDGDVSTARSNVINARLPEEGARLNTPITIRLGPLHPRPLLLVGCLSPLGTQRLVINGYV